MTTPCPGRDRLRRLLEESLAAPEQQALQAHLETCAACQQALDRLAAGGGTWDRAAAHLGPAPDPAGPALQQVVCELQSDPPTESAPHPRRPELPFLDPPAVAGHLGRLGHYEVLEIIGRGGMGLVLKAHDEQLQRIVAIKVLGTHYAASAGAQKRFRREARSAAAINHDNVVPIYHVGEVNEVSFLVMPLILGKSLQEHIDRSGPLPVKEVVRIGHQIACGLAAAHAQGLVHRDIKPANILLESGVERVKITDFGLARAIDDAGATQSGMISGTPLFMSPEQARGEDSVDHRSDLFSLGSVLYMMCTDRPPFRASGTHATLKRVIEDTPRPIRELNLEVPPWLEAIITRLHAKDPADRFQSAAEVAELLRQHLAHLQDPRHSPPPPMVTLAPAAQPGATLEKLLEVTAHGHRALQHVTLLGGFGLMLLTLAAGSASEAVVLLVLAALVILLLASRLKRHWDVSYRGHRIRFETNCLLGERLWIDGERVARCMLGRSRELRGLIRHGEAAGAEVMVLIDSGLGHFRCRIFAAAPPRPPRPGARPPPAEPAPRWKPGFGCGVLFALLPLVFLPLGCWVSYSSVMAPPRPLPPPPAPVPAPKGWVQLFNGTDLTGWKTLLGQPGDWEVEDGILVGRGPALGHLFTERDDYYGFHLRAEVAVNAEGKGGIYFRTPFEVAGDKDDQMPPATRVEITGADHPGELRTGGFLRTGPPPWRGQNAGLRLMVPDTFFDLEILANGSQYTTKIDGKVAAVAEGDVQDMRPGHLALQVRGPGTVLRFRKIEIRDLKPW